MASSGDGIDIRIYSNNGTLNGTVWINGNKATGVDNVTANYGYSATIELQPWPRYKPRLMQGNVNSTDVSSKLQYDTLNKVYKATFTTTSYLSLSIRFDLVSAPIMVHTPVSFTSLIIQKSDGTLVDVTNKILNL